MLLGMGYECTFVLWWGCGAVQDDEFPMTQGTDIWFHRIMHFKFIGLPLISLLFSD